MRLGFEVEKPKQEALQGGSENILVRADPASHLPLKREVISGLSTQSNFLEIHLHEMLQI
jgi:hypothetical protein